MKVIRFAFYRSTFDQRVYRVMRRDRQGLIVCWRYAGQGNFYRHEQKFLPDMFQRFMVPTQTPIEFLSPAEEQAEQTAHDEHDTAVAGCRYCDMEGTVNVRSLSGR